jgi:hypothetical protein
MTYISADWGFRLGGSEDQKRREKRGVAVISESIIIMAVGYPKAHCG